MSENIQEYILPQVASEVSKALAKALTSVQTINGQTPDSNGNVEVPENSGKKSVTSYNCPTEVPLESGSQYIFYGSAGGTISVQVGSNENNKVEYQLSSGFDIVWLLYVQTSDVQGSIIATSGTRKVINFEGDSSKMKISSTIPIWIAIKVSQGSGGNASKYPDWSHLKWYVIGDSLTAPDGTKRYYDFVQEKTGIQIEVDGAGGTGYGAGMGNNPPNNFLTRVQNLFKEENKHILDDVDVVTIFGSGNDVDHMLHEQYSDELSNIPIWQTLAEFANNKPGLRVIVIPPSPWTWRREGETQEAIDLWKAKWKAYCDRLKECAVACNFRYVSDMHDCPPFNPNFTGHMAKYFSDTLDGVHPNEEGHKAMAPYFYNALLQELAFKL